MRINKKYTLIIVVLMVILIAILPFEQSPPNVYIQRDSGVHKTEKVAGEKWLSWLYTNPVGEATMFTLVKRKFVSIWYGNYMDTKSSVKKIAPFVHEFNINMEQAKKKEFNSFNDFFTRKLKDDARPIDTNSNVIISPADGKILGYPNIKNSDFIIKGSRFNVATFLNNATLASKYNDGSLIIIRLAPYDYHRFHFPVSGKISKLTKINGDLYSVNPIALRNMADIFIRNKREYVEISTKFFGDVIMAEVGATMVGTIVQTYDGSFVKKGAEKGFFKFGGSTVVLIFEKDKIVIDNDLVYNTLSGFETEVLMGEKIAIRK